jgi:hypothetical protein
LLPAAPRGISAAETRQGNFWSTEPLLQIALFTLAPRWPLARQTPGHSLSWEGCSFVVNPAGGRFDGCLVYDGMLTEARIDCPPDRLILVTGEPPTIKSYHEDFAAQFSAVVTCHADLPHPRLVLGAQGYPWIAGMDKNAADFGRAAKGYDAFRAAAPPAKQRLISVVVSDKAITPAHRHRRRLVAALRAHFGEELAIFGRGVRDIGDKEEALAPFKYHLAIENSACFHYWTEKLADPLLCWSFPFYWGCPNIGEYFPREAYEPINLYDPPQAIATIEAALASGRYEAALPALGEARRRGRDDDNLFAIAARLCLPRSALPAAAVRLRPERDFRDHWTRKLRHRAKRALPRRWRKEKTPPLGAPL